jgi:hypothetical protein
MKINVNNVNSLNSLPELKLSEQIANKMPCTLLELKSRLHNTSQYLMNTINQKISYTNVIVENH